MQRIDSANDYGTNGWNEIFLKKNGQWRDKDYRYLDEVFRIATLSGTLLDAGCALGDGLLYLQRRCPRVTGFSGTDFSEAGIEVCCNNRQLDFAHFFQHDLMRPLPNRYDNVICLQTVEHTPDPELVFTNLLDATGRLLIVATPYKNRRPDENHLWSFDESDFQTPQGLYRLTQQERNIFWLVDKEHSGAQFRGGHWNTAYHRVIDFIAKVS